MVPILKILLFVFKPFLKNNFTLVFCKLQPHPDLQKTFVCSMYIFQKLKLLWSQTKHVQLCSVFLEKLFYFRFLEPSPPDFRKMLVLVFSTYFETLNRENSWNTKLHVKNWKISPKKFNFPKIVLQKNYPKLKRENIKLKAWYDRANKKILKIKIQNKPQ